MRIRSLDLDDGMYDFVPNEFLEFCLLVIFCDFT